MRHKVLKVLTGIECLLIAFLLMGCELGSIDTLSSETATVDVSGTWLYTDTSAAQWTMVITQNVSTVSGITTEGVAVTGSIYSNVIALTVANTNALSLDGTVGDDAMTGTFTNNASPSLSGTWTAVRTN
jgi:hypothetical protein